MLAGPFYLMLSIILSVSSSERPAVEESENDIFPDSQVARKTFPSLPFTVTSASNSG